MKPTGQFGKRWPPWSGPLLFFTAGLGLAGCGRKGPPAPPPPPEPKVEGQTVIFPPGAPQLASLTVQSAEPRTLAITHLTGRLYWAEDSTVRVFTPIMGQVTAIRAEAGQAVSAGTPLAIINSPDFGQALADARTATANLAAADKTFTRAKDLFAHGAAAQKDVEAAEAAYAAALAERDRTQARLKLYGGSESETGEDYVLRSPVKGVVVEKNINPGQEVRNDQMLANAPNLFAPLFVIGDPTRLWVQLDAADSDLPSLRTGEKIRIHSNVFPGQVFAGVIENVGEELDPTTRTVKVRGAVDNPDKRLKAEMYVMADVVQDESKVETAGVNVPAKAVFMIADQYYLFVEQSPGRFQRRRVKIGTEKDGLIPIVSGIAPGDRVAAEGALLLQSLVDPAD